MQDNSPNNKSYIKDTAANVLRRFFQKRKLALVEELKKKEAL